MNESLVPRTGDIGAQIDAFVTQFPELYHNHVKVANYVEDWADRVVGEVARDRALSSFDQDYLIGYHQALLDMAYHLRQGDCLPGGPVCEPMATRASGIPAA